jgi:hypothetical protein
MTVTAQSKTWTVFARTYTEIVGSNPTGGMDVCVYFVFVLSCVGGGLASGWSPVQGVLPTEREAKAHQNAVEPNKEEKCLTKMSGFSLRFVRMLELLPGRFPLNQALSER